MLVCVCGWRPGIRSHQPEDGVWGAAGLQWDGVAHLVADVHVHFVSHTQSQVHRLLPAGLRAHHHPVAILGWEAELCTPLGNLETKKKQRLVRIWKISDVLKKLQNVFHRVHSFRRTCCITGPSWPKLWNKRPGCNVFWDTLDHLYAGCTRVLCQDGSVAYECSL